MKQFTLKSLLLMLTIFFGGVNAWGQDNQVLFHESFGNNSSSARVWDDSYSVKTGIDAVFSGISAYSVENVKQGKNTTGQIQSGLNQSKQNVDASIIIGPLNTADCSNMELSYYWKAGSIKGSYSTTAYYSTSSDGEYTLIGEGSNGATSFVLQKFNMPEEAQVSTLYLKIVWNTSNTGAIIDEVDLSGIYTSNPSTLDKPTFSLAEGTYWKEQTLELTTTVEDGTIYYTIDGNDPTETSSVYSSPIPIKETTTVKACVKDANGNSSAVVARTYTIVPSIVNTQETAYTTAKAIELIKNTSAAQLADEKVYVKGVVSKVESYNSKYGSITYWLDKDAFEVYSGLGLDSTNFNAMSDVEVGATVIVYGNVKKYNSTYEFDFNNYLVSYTAPKSASLPATDGTAYYATFSSDKAVEFVDATVYAVNVEKGVLQLNEVTSKQVPAKTGVLLKSEKETAPYFYIDEAATIDNNLLMPASQGMSGISGSYKFYKLAYDDYVAKTGLGFYWGANDGGEFTVKAGTAYLAVPNAASVKGFLLDGTPTAIEGVEAENNTDVIYNLSGQRVQKAQRGLYIVNGKKLMVK